MERILLHSGKTMKLDFMKAKKNVLTWRQIEKRNGKVFMRMKIRPIIAVRGE